MLIRYVDDIFCVASNQAVFDNIFRILSSIHSSIQFSQEIEQHHQLSFLDVLLTRNGNTLQTSVYRKTTHTGLYTKWTSLCPLKFKRNLINYLLHRAYTICSSYIGMHKEFEFITTMLLKNGYPLNFIQTQICRFLDSKHQICYSKPPDKNLRRMMFTLQSSFLTKNRTNINSDRTPDNFLNTGIYIYYVKEPNLRFFEFESDSLPLHHLQVLPNWPY